MGSRHFQQQPTPPPGHRKVEVCEICGGIGKPKDILICPKCKISREHVYCRIVFFRVDYDDWACDDCKEKNVGVNDDVDQKGTHLSVKGKHQVIEKIVTKGKVKYIPSQEAIKLSLGSRRGEAPAKTIKKVTFHQKDALLKSPVISEPLLSNKQAHSVIKRSKISHDPIKLRAVQASRRELVQMVDPNSTMAPPKTKDDGLEKLSALKMCFGPAKPAMGTKLASSAEKISRPSEASSIQISSAMPAVKTRVASPRKEVDVPNEASLKKPITKPTPSGSHQVGGDLYPEVSDIGNRVLKNAEPKADKSYRVPARDSSWKGRVEIVGTFQNFYFNFEAHPCSRGSHKVFDCSKRMPQLLQFTPIHQKEVLGNLFQDNCPNADDIGLYFFSTRDKSTSGHDLILMFIEAQDYAMRCVLAGVELYILSSKTLSADHQKLDNEIFLWGIFRKVKKQKDVSELCKELPSAPHKPSDPPKNKEINDDDDCAVDMEIDMIGGYDLEEMKVVSRDSSVKKEQLLDCPPGFEEIYRTKILKI